jgi:hypothetical protein
MADSPAARLPNVGLKIEASCIHMSSAARTYVAFGVIGTTFRELEWKTIIFFERVVPITPNAW